MSNSICRYGGLAVLLQTSPESANIFVLLQKIFRKQPAAALEPVATAAGLTSEEYQVHHHSPSHSLPSSPSPFPGRSNSILSWKPNKSASSIFYLLWPHSSLDRFPADQSQPYLIRSSIFIKKQDSSADNFCNSWFRLHDFQIFLHDLTRSARKSGLSRWKTGHTTRFEGAILFENLLL